MIIRDFKYLILFLFTIFLNSILIAEEMIIGEEKIDPGIELIFEGAIKDDIFPEEFYLSEQKSDIHIEALATWTNDAPDGSVEGGFVPYLEIKVKIINQKICVIKIWSWFNLYCNFFSKLLKYSTRESTSDPNFNGICSL